MTTAIDTTSISTASKTNSEFAFSCDKTALREKILAIKRIIPDKAISPDHSHVLHILSELRNGQLFMTAFDLTNALTVCLDVDQRSQNGQILIPGQLTWELIDKMEGQLEFNLDNTNQRLLVRAVGSKKTSYKLPTLPASQYPQIPNLEEANHFTVNSEDLKEGVQTTIGFVSEDDTKQILMGICFRFNKETQKLELAASNGRDLGLFEGITINSNKPIAPIDMVIPSKGIKELIKILASKPDGTKVNMFYNNSLVKIESPESSDTDEFFSFLTRAINPDNTKFPQYRALIPTEIGGEMASVDRVMAIKALERISVLFSDAEKKKGNMALVEVSFSFDGMIISYASDVSEGIEEVGIGYTGQTRIMSFNCKQLLENLKNINDETVVIFFSGLFKPILIRPYKEGNKLTQLLAPTFSAKQMEEIKQTEEYAKMKRNG